MVIICNTATRPTKEIEALTTFEASQTLMSSQFCQSSQPKKGSEEDKKYGNININLRVKAKENKKNIKQT